MGAVWNTAPRGREALRKRLLGTTPGGEAPPVLLKRVRPRTLITLVAGVVGAGAAAWAVLWWIMNLTPGTRP